MLVYPKHPTICKDKLAGKYEIRFIKKYKITSDFLSKNLLRIL